MDALLILGGLLLILGGLAWLIMRAFSVSLFWGLGSLLPPMNLIFVLLKWRKASSPVTLAALGFIPLVIGFAMLANRDSEQLDAILRLSWLRAEVQQVPALGIQLRGELNGRSFTPQEGELIGGVLTLRERRGGLVERELRIHLSHTSPGPLRINILPEDHGQLPLMEINWSVPNLIQPKTQHLAQGYTLHLDLEPKAPNLLVGDFHLVLPERFRTSLSGWVELSTNELHYRNGKADAHFDSEDALAYVIKDYLARLFETDAVQLHKFSHNSLPARHLEVEVDAFIDDKARHLLVNMTKDGLRGWRVEGDRFPQLPVSIDKPIATADAELHSDSTLKPVDRRQGFSLQRLQLRPAEYQQLRMRIVTMQGGTADGLFTGVDEKGYLILQRHLGGRGTASYMLSPRNIQSIELLEP
ncbi:MFS transporter [Azotobacter armeniacus]